MALITTFRKVVFLDGIVCLDLEYFFDFDSIFPLFVLFISGQARYVRPQFLNTMFDPSSPGASATSPGNFYYCIA